MDYEIDVDKGIRYAVLGSIKDWDDVVAEAEALQAADIELRYETDKGGPPNMKMVCVFGYKMLIRESDLPKFLELKRSKQLYKTGL